jgi:hypothetical protein
MAQGSTQPLTEMSTSDLPGGKERLTRKTDHLTAVYEPLVKKCGSLNVTQPYWPDTGISLPFVYICIGIIFNSLYDRIVVVPKTFTYFLPRIW